MLIRDERQLAVHLRRALQEHYGYKKILSNVSLATARLRKYWEEWFPGPGPIPQPDIDILVVHLGDFIGIELKYIRGRPKDVLVPGLPYYDGVGQCLALLGFGLDCVQLWHCFSASLNERAIARSIEATRSLLFNLKVPIGFAALIV